MFWNREIYIAFIVNVNHCMIMSFGHLDHIVETWQDDDKVVLMFTCGYGSVLRVIRDMEDDLIWRGLSLLSFPPPPLPGGLLRDGPHLRY